MGVMQVDARCWPCRAWKMSAWDLGLWSYFGCAWRDLITSGILICYKLILSCCVILCADSVLRLPRCVEGLFYGGS